MVPAGKRLHTCQPIVGHGVLRLKHNADLAPMKRKAEIRFKLLLIDCKIAVFAEADLPALARSEEHTSELQSLMRISYAVFCLKKKKKPLELHIPFHAQIYHTPMHIRSTHTIMTIANIHL